MKYYGTQASATHGSEAPISFLIKGWRKLFSLVDQQPRQSPQEAASMEGRPGTKGMQQRARSSCGTVKGNCFTVCYQKDALLEENLKLEMYYIYFGDHLYLFKQIQLLYFSKIKIDLGELSGFDQWYLGDLSRLSHVHQNPMGQSKSIIRVGILVLSGVAVAAADIHGRGCDSITPGTTLSILHG